MSKLLEHTDGRRELFVGDAVGIVAERNDERMDSLAVALNHDLSHHYQLGSAASVEEEAIGLEVEEGSSSGLHSTKCEFVLVFSSNMSAFKVNHEECRRAGLRLEFHTVVMILMEEIVLPSHACF